MRSKWTGKSRFNRSLLAPVFVALAMHSGAAVAQDADFADQQGAEAEAGDYIPGEIIVTAQRRSESLQKVPVAMTALSSETLANQGVSNLSNLATAAPSLKVVAYPNSSDTLTLTMRGQGAGDVGQLTRDGGVAIYIDGFYMARPQGALLDLGDPERIEVLRGPQGTLYGRNTTGGAINVITTKPTGEWGGSGSLSIGSRNLVRGVASLDLPEIGNLSIKGTISYVNQDGWVENVGEDRDFGEFGQLAGRVAAKWTPSDSFTAHYAFNQGRVTTTPLYYISPDLEGQTSGPLAGYNADRDKTYTTLNLDSSVSRFVDHQLTLEWDVSDSFQLRSLTAYRGFRAFQNMNYGLAQGTVADPLTVEQRHWYRTKQYSQELQLVGDITDRLTFTGGLYWYQEKGTHDSRNDVTIFGKPNDTNPDNDDDVTYLDNGQNIIAKSESYAGYAQSTWTPGLLDDRLKLTVGGRYTKDKRSASRQTVYSGLAIGPFASNDQKFDKFTPMANLAVEWTNSFMTYAKYSQAYKAGGSGEGAPDFSATFGPETVTAWEAGFKAQLFDRMVTLNGSAFLNKFDDMQIDFVASPTDLTVITTANAGKATIKGVELDLLVRPTADFSFTASFSHLDQNLKRVNVLPDSIFDPAVSDGLDGRPLSPHQVGENIAGLFTLPFVPKFAYSVGADWTFLRLGDEEFSAHANYSYQSAVYTSSGAGPDVPGRDNYRNDPVKNLNARISWTRPIPSGQEMKISIFADNLLNDRRTDFAVGLGGTALTGYTAQSVPYNEPRTIGGELKLSF